MNPKSANVHDRNVKRVTTTPIDVANHGHAISVSGLVNDFRIVGIAASPSARILKIIAIVPTFVISHKTNPSIERNPQTRSKRVIFHSAFLFTNDDIKTRRGRKPVLNVIIEVIPTPCFIIAAKAINGAIDQRRNETRFGFTFPFTVSTM